MTGIKARYGIAVSTVNRWVTSGNLPKPKYINGQRVWLLDELDAHDDAVFSSNDLEAV